MLLLDTDTLSSSRRRRDKAGDAFSDWIGRTDGQTMFLSAISILEITVGARLVARRDVRQGEMLDRWIANKVLPEFAGRILPFDHKIAIRCAALHGPDSRPERDAMIGATALHYGFTVVTRNVRDFAPMGVPVLNPWETT